MRDDARGTSGNQVRINIYWLIKGRGMLGTTVSPHVWAGDMSPYMPAAVCLRIPTGSSILI